MSIIGPRPCGFSEEDLIEARKESGALKVRPGLTGLAQISGRDVLAEDVVAKAKLDGEYAKKIIFWRDLKIFLKTIVVVLREDDVVEGTAEERAQTEELESEVLAEVAATETEKSE